MADKKTTFWRKMEGIAYSSKQWMPQLVELDTARGTTPHGDPYLEVSFLMEDHSKAIEDMKRALLIDLFNRHNEVWLSQVNDTFIKVRMR